MKWIVVAILVAVVPYTYLNLKYRKTGPAHQPYQDNKDRAGVLRLLAAGYQRIDVIAARPMDPREFRAPSPVASTSSRPGGVPPMLSQTLIDKPLVPAEILTVQASAVHAAEAAYELQFTCTQPELSEQLAQIQAYVHGNQLTLLPAFEPLEGELQSRFLESTVRLTLPAGALKPASYEVTLVGARGSQAWTLEVR